MQLEAKTEALNIVVKATRDVGVEEWEPKAFEQEVKTAPDGSGRAQLKVKGAALSVVELTPEGKTARTYQNAAVSILEPVALEEDAKYRLAGRVWVNSWSMGNKSGESIIAEKLEPVNRRSNMPKGEN